MYRKESAEIVKKLHTTPLQYSIFGDVEKLDTCIYNDLFCRYRKFAIIYGAVEGFIANKKQDDLFKDNYHEFTLPELNNIVQNLQALMNVLRALRESDNKFFQNATFVKNLHSTPKIEINTNSTLNDIRNKSHKLFENMSCSKTSLNDISLMISKFLEKDSASIFSQKELDEIWDERNDQKNIHQETLKSFDRALTTISISFLKDIQLRIDSIIKEQESSKSELY